jgi:hypothetical protein
MPELIKALDLIRTPKLSMLGVTSKEVLEGQISYHVFKKNEKRSEYLIHKNVCSLQRSNYRGSQMLG